MREPAFEATLREQLAAVALERPPGEPPYQAILQQGKAARRRRTLVLSAALAGLVALPGAAIAAGATWGAPAGTAVGPAAAGTTGKAASTSPSPARPSAGPSASPVARPLPPASPGQLVDGISLDQAADALKGCLDFEQRMSATAPAGLSENLGSVSDYRILLAMRSTGDDNAPGDGMNVVAVRQNTEQTRIICNQRPDGADGVNVGGPESAPDLVEPDINGGKLYRQAMLDGDAWKLPYRWGSIGTVKPGVARVTVSYGSAPAVDATLDHGWFAATGILTASVTRTPHVRGYDANGRLVYDSDDDKGYQKSL